MLEKGIESAILCYLRLEGIFAFKVNTTGIYDIKKKTFRKSFNPFILKGVSDILGVIGPKGRMLAIEVKTPKRRKNLTEHQLHFLQSVRDYGGIAFVATSVDDVIRELSRGQ